MSRRCVWLSNCVSIMLTLLVEQWLRLADSLPVWLLHRLVTDMIWCCCQIWAHLITSTCARHSSAAIAVTGFHSHITYWHMNCKVQWFKSGIDHMMLLRCLTLSNRVPWQNWMAAYLGYTLRMRTLFRGWPVMAHETHTRRRRLPPQSDHNTLKYHTQALCGCVPGAVELALSVSWVDGVKGDLNQTLASLDLVLCTLVSSLVPWVCVVTRGCWHGIGWQPLCRACGSALQI